MIAIYGKAHGALRTSLRRRHSHLQPGTHVTGIPSTVAGQEAAFQSLPCQFRFHDSESNTTGKTLTEARGRCYRTLVVRLSGGVAGPSGGERGGFWGRPWPECCRVSGLRSEAFARGLGVFPARLRSGPGEAPMGIDPHGSLTGVPPCPHGCLTGPPGRDGDLLDGCNSRAAPNIQGWLKPRVSVQPTRSILAGCRARSSSIKQTSAHSSRLSAAPNRTHSGAESFICSHLVAVTLRLGASPSCACGLVLASQRAQC